MDAVLDINDKETGEMTAKFKIAYHSSIKKGSDCSKGYINARLSLLFKDGKVKYKLSDFRHDPTPDLRNCIVTYDFGLITNGTAPRIKHGWGKKWSENVWQEMQEVVSINASYIKSSLIEYFKLGHKSDEW